MRQSLYFLFTNVFFFFSFLESPTPMVELLLSTLQHCFFGGEKLNNIKIFLFGQVQHQQFVFFFRNRQHQKCLILEKTTHQEFFFLVNIQCRQMQLG